jgi:hypothetical protein
MHWMSENKEDTRYNDWLDLYVKQINNYEAKPYYCYSRKQNIVFFMSMFFSIDMLSIPCILKVDKP